MPKPEDLNKYIIASPTVCPTCEHTTTKEERKGCPDCDGVGLLSREAAVKLCVKKDLRETLKPLLGCSCMSWDGEDCEHIGPLMEAVATYVAKIL